MRLPIDTEMKIDGSFIAGFDREADNVIIASAVILAIVSA